MFPYYKIGCTWTWCTFSGICVVVNLLLGLLCMTTCESYDNANYFIGPNATDWRSAQIVCENPSNPSKNGTLVVMESKEEMDFVVNFIKSDVPKEGRSYWIGAVGDDDTGYHWVSDKSPFTGFDSWAKYHPPMFNHTKLQAQTNVLLQLYSNSTVNFKVGLGNCSHYYVCKVAADDTPIPCYNKTDLIIILDSSASMGEAHYKQCLAYASSIASGFADFMGNRIGFIIYGAKVKMIFPLSYPTHPTDMLKTIENTEYMDSLTRTDLALNAAVKQFRRFERHVSKKIVLITDGESNFPKLTATSADRAIAYGISTITLGITSEISKKELLRISRGNENKVFHAEDFDALMNDVKAISLAACGTN